MYSSLKKEMKIKTGFSRRLRETLNAPRNGTTLEISKGVSEKLSGGDSVVLASHQDLQPRIL